MFEQAVIDFKAGADINTLFADVFIGAVAVFGAVQTFEEGLPVCEAIDTSKFDFKPLEEGLDIAAYPRKHMEMIAKDLVAHGVSIFEDIEKATLAYKGGNYKEFGKTIAKIMKLVSAAQEAKLKAWGTQEKLGQLALGFFETIGVGQFSPEALFGCIYEAD